MKVFDAIESSVYVPVVARAYTSKNFPNIFYDEKSLTLDELIPTHVAGETTQSQYTMVGTAVRVKKMDMLVQEFLKRNPNGVIVNLGCGLDTAFYRCKNSTATWYEVDLPEVINYHKLLLEENPRDILIECDAFKPNWIQTIRDKYPREPIFIMASGLFQYYTERDVKDFFNMLKYYGNIEISFEVFNDSGMKEMAKFIRNIGRDVEFFTANNSKAFASQVKATLLHEEPMFANIDLKGMAFKTKLCIKRSIALNYCRLVHIKMNADNY